ncbi:DUF1801 domain-containing protein [Sedimentitalea nanhaiensis]|nr:DUF1801 domain-containing protein [Sedimentitalea nanhaiensis]
MTRNKTQQNNADVEAFLSTVLPAHKAEDARRLDRLFQEVSGFAPRMWGASIIGYGRYCYVYDSVRQGDLLATGFAPRKAAFSIYILPGYTDFSSILDRLGKHRIGKSCLYVAKLADIDLGVLARLIRAGLDDLDQRWPVHPV